MATPIINSQVDQINSALNTLGSDLATLRPLVKDTIYGAYPTVTITNQAIASFPDGADLPVKDLTVAITPVQSGSGDPSPSNVRPISGWSSIHIGTTNENILKYRSDIEFPTDSNGITYAQGADGRIKISGTASANSFFNLTASSTGRYRFVPGQTYRFKLFDAPTGVTLQLYIDGSSVNYSANFTHTFPASFSTAYVRIRVANGTAISTAVEVAPMVTVGSTEPSTYVPCVADFPSVSWTTPSTVYGGTLDVTTGVLTVTDANIASYAGETLPSTWICDRAVYVSGTTPPTGSQVVYKLATPTTVQLTPEATLALKTLYGGNNIWADCGDVINLEYKADTALYVQKMIANSMSV